MGCLFYSYFGRLSGFVAMEHFFRFPECDNCGSIMMHLWKKWGWLEFVFGLNFVWNFLVLFPDNAMLPLWEFPAFFWLGVGVFVMKAFGACLMPSTCVLGLLHQVQFGTSSIYYICTSFPLSAFFPPLMDTTLMGMFAASAIIWSKLIFVMFLMIYFLDKEYKLRRLCWKYIFKGCWR